MACCKFIAKKPKIIKQENFDLKGDLKQQNVIF